MGVVPHVTGEAEVDRNRRLWRRWVVAVTVGELVGFTVPSIAGGIAWALGAAPGVLFEVLVCAGACEGSMLATRSGSSCATSFRGCLLVPAFGAGGIALLLSIGTAQSLVLRGRVRRAWRWIPANALAWCAGLIVAVSLMSVLLTEDTTLPGGIAIGAAAGVLMGAVVAAVTGWFLVRILESR